MASESVKVQDPSKSGDSSYRAPNGETPRSTAATTSPRGCSRNPRRNAQIPAAVSHSRPGLFAHELAQADGSARKHAPSICKRGLRSLSRYAGHKPTKYSWKPDQDCPKLSPPTQPRDPPVCYMPSRLPHRPIDPAGRPPVLDPGSISLAPRVLVNQTPNFTIAALRSASERTRRFWWSTRF